MVKAMRNRTFRLETNQLDMVLWQNLYYKYQQEYIRKKLLAIKYLFEGKSRIEVSELLGCHYKTITSWIDKYLEAGLLELVQPITHKVKSRLNIEQKHELKQMLLSEKRIDYGIDYSFGQVKLLVMSLNYDGELN